MSCTLGDFATPSRLARKPSKRRNRPASAAQPPVAIPRRRPVRARADSFNVSQCGTGRRHASRAVVEVHKDFVERAALTAPRPRGGCAKWMGCGNDAARAERVSRGAGASYVSTVVGASGARAVSGPGKGLREGPTIRRWSFQTAFSNEPASDLRHHAIRTCEANLLEYVVHQVLSARHVVPSCEHEDVHPQRLYSKDRAKVLISSAWLRIHTNVVRSTRNL